MEREPHRTPHEYDRVVSRHSSRRLHRPMQATQDRPSGIFIRLLEQNHIFSRATRLGQHLPTVFGICGTVAGIMALPLILFVFLICGSIGISMMFIILLEGGFFVMAVLGVMSSLLVPLLAALPFAAVSYITYQTSHQIKSFMWNHFGGPIRQYYSVKRRFENAIASFRSNPAIEYPRTPPTGYDINYDGYGQDSEGEPEVVIEHYEREQSLHSFVDQWQNIRRRFSEGVALHDDADDYMGVAEGACLYMADYMHNLFSMAFFFALIYLFVQAVSPPPEVHYY